MKNVQYIALLRGVNVGGKGMVSMTVLKERLTAIGLQDVATYINSGNVLFSTSKTDINKLAKEIAQDMAKTFGHDTRLIIYSHEQFKKVVSGAPKGFGTKPELYRCDVIYLVPPLAAPDVMSQIMLREEVDTADKGDGVVYFSRLAARSAQSKLNRIVSLPVYKDMTIRNWNTTTKLLTMMDARATSGGS
jgi:uncharacterized protein (DUF1697 family)